MRLEQFYIFVKIAEMRSIRKASRALYTTPQNLSKAMIQMEDELKVKLYDRLHSGIQLTQQGEEAYELIKNILADVDRLREHFQLETLDSKRGQEPVEILTCPILDSYANSVVNMLFQNFPKAPVNYREMSRGAINRLLEGAGKISADIVLTNMISDKVSVIHSKTRQNYRCYFLYEDELRLQVPKGSPFENYETIPLGVLTNLPLLLFDLDLEKSEFEKWLEQEGYNLENISRTSNLDTCSQVALNNKKYCFVGYPSVELRPLPNVVYIPLEKPLYTSQLMFIKKQAENREYLKAFYDTMDQYFNLKEVF